MPAVRSALGWCQTTPFKRTNAKGHREDCEHIEPLCGEPLLLHRLVMVRVRVRARAGVGVRVRR